jgi:hypothetical protein
MLFVQVGAVGELEGAALQAVDREAEGVVERAGGVVGRYDAEIDLLEPGQ